MTQTAIAPIDAQTAYELLAAAVELAGRDHVYEPPDGTHHCVYVEPDLSQPSCMVGVALSIHGVPLEMLDVRTSADCLPNKPGFGFISGDAAEVFAAAQGVQDGITYDRAKPEDHTWGLALDAAAAKLARIAAGRV